MVQKQSPFCAICSCPGVCSFGCSDGINNKKINRKIEVSHVVRPPCYKDVHQVLGQPFCCEEDKLCWSNLGECFINCPCKINCLPSVATQHHMIPTSKHT